MEHQFGALPAPFLLCRREGERICRETNPLADIYSQVLTVKTGDCDYLVRLHTLWPKGIPTNISANHPIIGDTYLLRLLVSRYVLWSYYLHWIIDFCLDFSFFFSFHCYIWDPIMPFCTRLKSSSESDVFSWLYKQYKVTQLPLTFYLFKLSRFNKL